jgi:hypothetical protein
LGTKYVSNPLGDYSVVSVLYVGGYHSFCSAPTNDQSLGA